MPDLAQQIVDTIREMPLLLKFLALTAAVAIEYIFPIFPGDTVVILAGFLNAQGAVDLVEISFAIVLGSLIGAAMAWKLGQLLARDHHKYGWVKRLTASEDFNRFNHWYQKWGFILLLLNRFFPAIRSLLFFAAGAARLSLVKVLVLGGLSAIIFNGCLVLLGYWLGYNAETILAYFYRYNTIAYIIFFIILIATGIYIFIKYRYKR